MNPGQLLRSVFIVRGDTGAYSDYTQWDVAVYTNREQAEEHCRRLQELARTEDYWKSQESPYDACREASRQIQQTELDPLCSIDDTGTDYTVVELPLYCHLDEYLESSSKEGPSK